jgi:septal ring factor EnvC (AmiA/AmiB activator)
MASLQPPVTMYPGGLMYLIPCDPVQENSLLKKRIQELESENHNLLQSKADEINLVQTELVTIRSEMNLLKTKNQDLENHVGKFAEILQQIQQILADLNPKIEKINYLI